MDEQDFARLTFEHRLVSISTVLQDGKITYTGVTYKGEVGQGWTEKNDDGMTILHWYRLNMTFHWYQPGDTPA